MGKFENLTIEKMTALVAEGYRFAEGRPANGGYQGAREGGGYVAKVTPTPTPCVTVVKGTPAYHGMVCWHVGQPS